MLAVEAWKIFRSVCWREIDARDRRARLTDGFRVAGYRLAPSSVRLEFDSRKPVQMAFIVKGGDREDG